MVRQFGAWDDAFQDMLFEDKRVVQNYQIVEQAGQKVGAIWISQEPDHLWLRELQIAPSHQDQGIGTRLLLKAMDEATKSGLPLRLRVLTENRAQALYQRLGFKVVGMHGDTHYWMELRDSNASL